MPEPTRRVSSFLLSLGAACLLAACGGSEPSSDSASASVGSEDRKSALVSEAGKRQSAVAARSLFGAPGSQAFLDLNRDGKADLLWYDPTRGLTSNWQMDGPMIIGGGDLLLSLDYKVVGIPDLDGDGGSDLLWRNDATGQNVVWLSGDGFRAGRALPTTGTDWRVIGAPDFDGDGKDDLLWYNPAAGETVGWLMDGAAVTRGEFLSQDPRYRVVALPDLDGDRRTDLVWNNAQSGETVAWLMSGLGAKAYAGLLTNPSFNVTGVPDLDGDGKSDLLWYSAATGATVAWLMDGAQVRGSSTLLVHPSFQVFATPDLNNDRKSDLLWYDAPNGLTVAWLMDGLNFAGGAGLLAHPQYRVVGTADINGDGSADLQWYDPSTSEFRTWLMNGAVRVLDAPLLGGTSFTLLNASGYPAPAAARRFTVGGSIEGLVANELVLAIDGQELRINFNQTSFAFPTTLADGTAYSLRVANQPIGQTCTVTNGAGAVSGSDVVSIVVRCQAVAPRSVQISGTIVYERSRPNSSLKDSLPGPGSLGLSLGLAGATPVAVSLQTSTFAFEVPEGSAYQVAVATQPSAHDCGVSPNGTGVAALPVSGIVVRCLEAMRNVFGEFDPNFGGGDSGASGGSGSAGDGAPIVGAKVEVYSVVNGVLEVRTAGALTDSFGRFTVDLRGLRAPLLAVVYEPRQIGQVPGNVTPKWYGLSLENPRAREFIPLHLSGLSDALVSGVSNNLFLCGSTSLKDALVPFLARNDSPELQLSIIREQIREALTNRIRSWEQDGEKTIPLDFDPVRTILDIKTRNFYDDALENMDIQRSPAALVGGEDNNLSFGGVPVCKTQVSPKGGLRGTAADF